MYFSIPLPPVPNCSFPFLFPLRGSARLYFCRLLPFSSKSHRLFPFLRATPSHTIVFHRSGCRFSWTPWNPQLVMYFGIKNNWKSNYKYKCLNWVTFLRYPSVFLPIVAVLRRHNKLLWVWNGKMWCFHFLPFTPSLSHSDETIVLCTPIGPTGPMGIPDSL